MPSESTLNNTTDKEAYEEIGITEAKDGKNQYECLLCKTQISSKKNIQDHIKGRKHKAKLKKKQKKSDKANPDEAATQVAPLTEPSKTIEESNTNSNPNKEMYSERYPPHSRGSWNPGFQHNHGDLNHQYPPPYHFRQTHGRNQHFPPKSNWYHDPNYYSFENQANYDPGPGNHRMSRDWPESSNSSNNYQESFDGRHQRSKGNQSYREKDYGYTSRRSRHESKEPKTNDTSTIPCNSTSNNPDSNKQREKSEATVHISKEQDTCDQNSNKEINKNGTKDSNVTNVNISSHSDKNPVSEKQKKVDGSETRTRVRNSSETSSTPRVSDIPKTQRRLSSENVTDRIAQLINPSNPKAKAEVLKLVTQFSKSKRKENLVKLNQQTDDSWEKSSYSKKKVKYAAGPTDASTQSVSLSARVDQNHETVQEASNINPFGQKVPRKREKRKNNLENSEPQVRKIRKKAPVSGIHQLERQLLREVEEEKLRNDSSTKHKCSSAECLESCINDVVQREDIATISASRNTPSSQKKTSKVLQKFIKKVYNPECILNRQIVSNESDSRISGTVNDASNPSTDISSNSETIQPRPVKQEVEASNMQFHPCLLEAFNLEEALNEQQTGNLNNSTGTMPVESLINLFASGTIKVKKEFDDPFIDMIRTVDPEILNQAGEAQTASISPGSSEPQNTSPSEPAMPTPEDNNANEGSEGDEVSDYPLLKASFKNILNEMQNISNLEEKVKTELHKAESKIQEFQSLIDEWKTKKMKLQSEEETLRKQRNSLVRTMADLVTQSNFENIEEHSQPTDPHASSVVSVNAEANQNTSRKVPSTPHKSSPLLNQDKTTDHLSNSVVDDTEEIAILPVPDKSSKIPVIDLEDSDSEASHPATESEKSSETGLFSDNFSGTISFPNHGASVNCLQVFEDYLYTCSNDSTARRFPLGKNSGMVVYNHQKRNVSHICVEKVRGLTLVFTICTGSKTVTAFKAKDGTPFRTYNLSFSVASLCKSKGLIYAGLRNGSIVVCNWKDHKELVNISEPIRSIDTTYQGRLNILVTLSVHGNVSIRDADRNGLLIRYVKARSYLPLFMTVCSDSVYLSSAGVMTVLNIESGTFSSKYSFSAAYTCLDVFRDSIFTASFSGLVRCYPKDEERLVKMYYGAGNTAITCIHVHKGYIFTGNRFGAVSVFKHDPDTVHPCKMGKCDFLFPRLEDLETHVLQGKYHVFPQLGTQCTWRKCTFVFPLVWEPEYIKIHLSDHLCSQA